MLALLVVGGIVVLVGWVMLIIAAFRTAVWWGLAVLVGPLIVGFAIRDMWLNLFVTLAIMFAFALPRLEEAKVGLIVYVVGCALAVPGVMAMTKQAEKAVQQQAAAEAEKSRKVQRVYTPPTQPVQAAAIPTPQPSAPAPAVRQEEAYPGIKMSRAEQVFATNSPKVYYPLDCKARPDNAYKMAKSLAVKQGYKLAAECGTSGP